MKTSIKKSTCPYCGVGCGLDLEIKNGKVININGSKEHPTNKGDICLIASNLHKVFDAKDRINQPLIRKNGNLIQVEWDEAIRYSANKLNEIIEKCKELGVEILYDGPIEWEQSKSVYIKDPSGYEIELGEVSGGGL